MARALGFTRARISQLMDLLLLAPDIQAEILFLDVPPGEQPLSERRLRDTVLKSLDWREQRRRWQALVRPGVGVTPAVGDAISDPSRGRTVDTRP